MRTRDRYIAVNATWPAGPLPALEPDEAIRAAKKLLRSEGRLLSPQTRFVPTTGNRFTWACRIPMDGGRCTLPGFRVNYTAGWKRLVHDLSHWVHRTQHPDARPHHWKHARIEARMIRVVVERGWLAGTLRSPKPSPGATSSSSSVPDALELARVWCAPRVDKMKRRMKQAFALERRIKRLTTLLKKRRRSVAGILRALQKSDHFKLLTLSGEVEA